MIPHIQSHDKDGGQQLHHICIKDFETQWALRLLHSCDCGDVNSLKISCICRVRTFDHQLHHSPLAIFGNNEWMGEAVPQEDMGCDVISYEVSAAEDNMIVPSYAFGKAT